MTQTTEPAPLVERLRNGTFYGTQALMNEAADEIERLRDEMALCCELKREYQEQAAAEREARQEAQRRLELAQEAAIRHQRDIALAVAAERERFPNLMPVIQWLENGCDPQEAAKELRAYQHLMRGPNAANKLTA